MLRVRRSHSDVRIEMTPLLDVIFLLLTFFLVSLVLMVRAEVMGVTLPQVSTDEPVRARTPITIALTAAGECTVNGEPVPIDELVDHVSALRDQSPDAPILIAVDREGRSGDMLRVIDRLQAGGITEFGLLGRRED